MPSFPPYLVITERWMILPLWDQWRPSSSFYCTNWGFSMTIYHAKCERHKTIIGLVRWDGGLTFSVSRYISRVISSHRGFMDTKVTNMNVYTPCFSSHLYRNIYSWCQNLQDTQQDQKRKTTTTKCLGLGNGDVGGIEGWITCTPIIQTQRNQLIVREICTFTFRELSALSENTALKMEFWSFHWERTRNTTQNMTTNEPFAQGLLWRKR